MAKVRQNKVMPYGADVRFYVDTRTKTVVPAWVDSKDYNKGWVDVRVGEYETKSRRNDAHAEMISLLREHYPANTMQMSFYEDLSYHSSLNQGKGGKVDNYGVGDAHMVQFSTYTPVARYKLLTPVKTSGPGDFGKTRSYVTSYDWEYVENNWIPGDPIKWKVTHKVKRANGGDDILFQSPVIINPDEALAVFNDRVVKAGGKPYKLPKSLEKVFERDWDRLSGAREGRVKIRRRTGRRRSSSRSTLPPTSMGGIR